MNHCFEYQESVAFKMGILSQLQFVSVQTPDSSFLKIDLCLSESISEAEHKPLQFHKLVKYCSVY